LEEDKTVVVVALSTTSFTSFDVLPAKVESPPYTAVIEFVRKRQANHILGAAEFLC
jgi:hypothetical protein